MNAVATTLLRWFGTLLYAAGLARLVIWLHRKEPKVLALHACEPEEHPGIRGLHSNTTPDELDALLTFLRRHYNVVPLAALEQGEYPERAVAITFDDGYRSVMTHALPRLQSHGVTATFYLVTGVVGNGAMVWVNELNWLLLTHPAATIPVAARALGTAEDPGAIVAGAVAHYDRAALDALLVELRRITGTDAAALAGAARLYVSWDDVAALAAAGMTIGNHTVSHPNLARLDAEAQQRELATAQQALAGRPGVTTSVAWPFGRWNGATARAAASLGCSSALTIGGVNRPLDRARVARVPVDAGGPAAFFAQAEIVEPLKARLRQLRGPRRTAAVAA